MVKTAWAGQRAIRGLALGTILVGLGGCAGLQAPPPLLTYDFGAMALDSSGATGQSGVRQPVVLADVESTSALDGSAIAYRLAYSDERQLRAYSRSRWTMPAAELVQQSMREQLGRRYLVLAASEVSAVSKPVPTLYLQLEEFSQWFDTAQTSHAVVRVRATWRNPAPGGTLEQQTFMANVPAQTADAAGGVQALARASVGLAQDVLRWLEAVQSASDLR
jgi:cholesterol transport system auxiliary component